MLKQQIGQRIRLPGHPDVIKGDSRSFALRRTSSQALIQCASGTVVRAVDYEEMKQPSILWLRQDLRLDDQPALAAAAADGPFVAVYILDDVMPGRWKIGGAQRWWLHHSLQELGSSLERRGTALLIRRGETVEELARLAAELGSRRVHATQHYERRDRPAPRAPAASRPTCISASSPQDASGIACRLTQVRSSARNSRGATSAAMWRWLSRR